MLIDGWLRAYMHDADIERQLTRLGVSGKKSPAMTAGLVKGP